jgi:TolA-binding protein
VPRRQLALLPAPLEPPPLAVAPIGGPSADEAATLLERAVTARRDGHLQAAIGAFRRLQADFPGTPEGLVSQVSVGDLFLRLALPAEALAAFEAYLRAAPTGALVPEALAGRARALAALGRETESRATWRELARRFSSQSSVGRRSGGTARVGE